MRNYRVWLEDSVEPNGGFWWYCFNNGDGYLRQVDYDYTGKEDELDTCNNILSGDIKLKSYDNIQCKAED